MTNKILFERQADWGVVTINNEEALNALDWDMVKALHKQLIGWAAENAVKAVLIKSAGEKAFCAGGDIRWLYKNAKTDPAGASEFFRDEYTTNALIYHYPKPYVALIDGITMGGGVGLSVHGDFRVAGDRTLFAMPETGIGLFPDVGGGHFLPRLNDGLGLYYALTGARAKAADCMAAGIATHFTTSDRHGALANALFSAPLGDSAHADIEAVLDEFSDDPGHAGINNIRGAIREHFEYANSMEGLMAALGGASDEFAAGVLTTLSRMSPTSMKLTFEQLKRGHELDFDETMKMEFRMVRRVMEGHDFFEGVRAQIIDKDRNPNWKPAEISDVSDDEAAQYFEPLGDDELTLP
ncbi:MAG: enoyl-CoA hydratase/isomerase family protein [Marinicaulis sp.]|nr:enoyl-CoA hydratase/isomerase family protein [Marinicaulis sp.]NNE41403.1 enoyl-CoA hydratase/isomerase family protein [Marinicaulis sp.]NNL89429.1 enoyl-CoA hydratase/isomerase family protein [Marinicaulis sp.]